MNKFKYKGKDKTKNYFEGWYLKVVDENSNLSYAFIIGITLYEKDPHAFIQIVNSQDKNPYYFRFNINDFYYNNDAIRIDNHVLSKNGLNISIDPFEINLSITPTTDLKNFVLTNSAMGCARFLPLKTYHDIIFMDAKVEGTIIVNGEIKEIHGTGYMEKNWGSCFPKRWLWIQTNHFKNYNASFVLATADICGSFKAFFAILNVDDEEFRFATYNGFTIKLTQDKNITKIIVEKDKICLIIEVKQDNGCIVIGPSKNGEMKKEIEESLTSTLTLLLYKDGKLIFEDIANNVGCENLYNV